MVKWVTEMGFEDELRTTATDIALGGDGSDDEALNDTARGMLISEQLGDDATEEDYREVVEQLKADGKSAAEAQMVVRASMMVLDDFGDEEFEMLNAALEDVYDIEIE